MFVQYVTALLQDIILIKQQRQDESTADDMDDAIRTRVVLAACTKTPQRDRVDKLNGELVVFQVSGVINLTNFRSVKNGQVSSNVGIIGDIIITNYQLAFRGYKSSEVCVVVLVRSWSKRRKHVGRFSRGRRTKRSCLLESRPNLGLDMQLCNKCSNCENRVHCAFASSP